MVVDGGSTDGSVEIIEKYADQLAWWVSEPDGGQADAINKGFRRARGDIVAWLNSDDAYFPGALSSAVEILRKNPDLGLVYGDVLSVDEAGQPIHLQTFKPYTLQDLMTFRIISQPGVFMRRAAWELAGPLDLSFQFLLDHHLWLRIAAAWPMEYLPHTLARASYHPLAKNVAQAARFGEEAFRLVAWMQKQDNLRQIFDANRRRIFGGAHRLDAYYQIEAGHFMAGIRAYARSARRVPMVVLTDWRRVLYALSGLVGFHRLAQRYRDRHRRELANT